MNKKFFALMLLMVALTGSALAQEKMEGAQPTDADKTANFENTKVLKRGAAIGGADKVSLKKVLADPAKYSGKTVLVKGKNGPGPYEAKGIGEHANVTPPAAIANAVADACGVRIFDTPVTAEKVYAALRAQR